MILAGLAALTALAWLYLAHLAAAMGDHSGMAMAMPMAAPWSPVELGWLVVMWAAMMVAMMIPSAAPVIFLFAGVSRRRRAQGVPAAPTAVFTAGYLLAWTGFSVLAATLQWILHAGALLSPAMASASPVLGGGILVAAGVYQWLPLKGACLTHCRSPLHFFTSEWREGTAGALLMGLRHGLFCVGCCWVLMLLLFVAGVMNLLWIAAIAGFVLIEKLHPHGGLVGRTTGVALVAWGVWVLAQGAA